MTLFSAGPCKDREYSDVRDSPDPKCREFVERLWLEYESFNNDVNFLTHAKSNFHQRFWEMYLCVTMLRRGLNVEKAPPAGPDFSIVSGGKRIWFEAIAVGAGTGDDQVPALDVDSCNWVPHEQVLLRHTQALYDKNRKYHLDREKGIVHSDDLYVVALNAFKIPHAYFGTTPPYILQAFLPVGPLTLEFDRDTGRKVDVYYKHRNMLLKKNGSEVRTDTFLNPDYCGVSALLHSALGVAALAHGSTVWGDSFDVLHNPLAAQPLPLDLCNWCDQFRVLENGQVETIERVGFSAKHEPSGLGFRDVMNVLADPEWMCDPEKKARGEAYKALEEVREARESASSG